MPPRLSFKPSAPADEASQALWQQNYLDWLQTIHEVKDLSATPHQVRLLFNELTERGIQLLTSEGAHLEVFYYRNSGELGYLVALTGSHPANSRARELFHSRKEARMAFHPTLQSQLQICGACYYPPLNWIFLDMTQVVDFDPKSVLLHHEMRHGLNRQDPERDLGSSVGELPKTEISICRRQHLPRPAKS